MIKRSHSAVLIKERTNTEDFCSVMLCEIPGNLIRVHTGMLPPLGVVESCRQMGARIILTAFLNCHYLIIEGYSFLFNPLMYPGNLDLTRYSCYHSEIVFCQNIHERTFRMKQNHNRPNILFAIADDASHMSAYGHSFVKTPNFDWVAENGALFTNAFTTNPKCAPSRASILTGMHTWQLEEACGHIMCSIPVKFAVYPDVLENAGYCTGYTGKGWAPGYWEEYGRSRNPAGPCYNDCKLEAPPKTNISTTDYTANFAAFLDDKPDDKPFCFWYGGREPHRHYVPGEGLRAGKKLTDVKDLPAYWPDDDVVRSDILDYAYEIEWFDSHLGNMLDILRKRGELENTIIVATSDNGCPFPRVKGQMYENDFHLPLAITWPKLQNGGRRVDDLVSFTDFAPTFLEAAGIEAHPQMAGRSLMPQIRSPRSGMIEEDRSEVYMGRECHDPGREGDKGYPVRCLREQQYLYVWNFKPERWPAGNPETLFTNCDGSPTKDLILELKDKGNNFYYNLAFGKRPAEELYDIEKDPECINNLANDKNLTAQKERMRTKLEKMLHATKDPRIAGGGEVFEDYVTAMLNDPKISGSFFWHYYKDASWEAYADKRWKLPDHMDWERFKLDKE